LSIPLANHFYRAVFLSQACQSRNTARFLEVSLSLFAVSLSRIAANYKMDFPQNSSCFFVQKNYLQNFHCGSHSVVVKYML